MVIDKEPYKFCYSCGGYLQVSIYAAYYDAETGAPIYHYSYRCPKQPRIWAQERHPVTATESYVFQG